MTILEKIDFEEEWLSEVNLTKENIKIALDGIRATARKQEINGRCVMKECSKCKYHDDELDMGGGSFIVCDHPERTSSWPDICPLDELNDIIKIMKQFRDRQGNSKDDIKAFNYVINFIRGGVIWYIE